MSATVDTILSRLDGVRPTRRGWQARCPAHRDRSPSLSIAVGDGGRPLLHCHAGCRYEEVARALKIETTATTRAITPPSPRLLALQIAQRQPGHRYRHHYQLADILRTGDQARRLVTHGGHREEVWSLLARVARIEMQALNIETHLQQGAA